MHWHRIALGFLWLLTACLVTPLSAEEFVVMTYNIRSAAGNGNFTVFGRELPHLVTRPRAGPKQIAQLASTFDVDLLGLQEVQGRSLRSFGMDQSKRIASKLGMKHTFGTPRRGLGALADRTGNAVLSRGDQRESQRLNYGDGRQATLTVVDQPGFPRGLLFATTHLSTGSDGTRRRTQLQKLVTAIAAYDLPTVLVGDFNASPDSAEIRALVLGDYGRPFEDAFAVGGQGPGFSAPALAPRHRIDYVFVSPGITVLDAKVVKGAAPLSDHLPVVVRLRSPIITEVAGLLRSGTGLGAVDLFGVRE